MFFVFMSLIFEHTTQISVPPTGFESAIPDAERQQAYALDRSATGIGYFYSLVLCLYFIRTYFFVLTLLHFVFTYNTSQTSILLAGFVLYSLVLCTLSVPVSLS